MSNPSEPPSTEENSDDREAERDSHGLTADDYGRIRAYLDKPAHQRQLADLVPDEE